MSDIPTGGNADAEPVDQAEDVELEDAEVEEAEAEVEEAGEEAGSETEAEEDGGAEDAQPAPAARGRARGEPYGAQIRRIEAQRVADKAEFDRQLQALMAERRQPTRAEVAEAQAQERANFEMMTPWEQHQYSRQVASREVQQRTQQISRNMWVENDQRKYAALLEADAGLRAFDGEVEQLRQRAPNISKEVLLWTAFGRKALQGRGAAKGRATRNAAAAAERHTVRAPNGRADVAADRGGRRDNLEEALRGQLI